MFIQMEMEQRQKDLRNRIIKLPLKIGIKEYRKKNIGSNYLGFQKIKLFGVVIILQNFYRLKWVGFIGIKKAMMLQILAMAS